MLSLFDLHEFASSSVLNRAAFRYCEHGRVLRELRVINFTELFVSSAVSWESWMGIMRSFSGVDELNKSNINDFFQLKMS